MLLLQHKLQMPLTSLVLDVITGTASIELLVTSLCKKRNDTAVSDHLRFIIVTDVTASKFDLPGSSC